MGLLDMFRRPPAIAGVGALEDFVDSHAAFLVQKCVFEYSRARAGIMWEKLFKERGFREAVDVARWQGFPIALGDVVEMAEGVLRPHVPGREPELLSAMVALSHNIVHRYPVPPGFPDAFWAERRGWLERRLGDIQFARPKAVKDVPVATAREMFDLLPIHESLRGEDFMMVRNHLRTNLCRIHEDFTRRADLEVLCEAVLIPPRAVHLPATG